MDRRGGVRVLPGTLSVVEDITTIAYDVDIFFALWAIDAINLPRLPFTWWVHWVVLNYRGWRYVGFYTLNLSGLFFYCAFMVYQHHRKIRSEIHTEWERKGDIRPARRSLGKKGRWVMLFRTHVGVNMMKKRRKFPKNGIGKRRNPNRNTKGDCAWGDLRNSIESCHFCCSC